MFLPYFYNYEKKDTCKNWSIPSTRILRYRHKIKHIVVFPFIDKNLELKVRFSFVYKNKKILKNIILTLNKHINKYKNWLKK